MDSLTLIVEFFFLALIPTFLLLARLLEISPFMYKDIELAHDFRDAGFLSSDPSKSGAFIFFLSIITQCHPSLE